MSARAISCKIIFKSGSKILPFFRYISLEIEKKSKAKPGNPFFLEKASGA